jgi:two-component system, cell cycle response regulator
MKILIADDDRVSRTVLRTALTKLGHEVVDVEDGVEAMRALLAQDGPRLAILDWMMPGADGLTVCATIRQQATAYVYVILLTARDREADLVEGLGAGADDFLTKPLNVTELAARLRSGERVIELQQRLLESQAALEHAATYDRLTGLWNRGTIVDHLAGELNRTQREGASLSVLLVDIDHFKRINDTYGHAAGDQVLCEISRRIRSLLRAYDAVGRYGGEEFLVVLPGADTSSARVVAERLRDGVHATPVTDESFNHEVSVSIGLACSDTIGFESAALILAADQALYRAKAAGRNRVEL